MTTESSLTSEDALTQGVYNALEADPVTAPFTIEVEAQGSQISLRGTVDHQNTKQHAEQVARSVPNVVSVINELVVDPDVQRDGGGGLFGTRRQDTDGTPTVGMAGFAAGATGAAGGYSSGAGPSGAAGPAAIVAGDMATGNALGDEDANAAAARNREDSEIADTQG